MKLSKTNPNTINLIKSLTKQASPIPHDGTGRPGGKRGRRV